jgi:lactate permease
MNRDRKNPVAAAPASRSAISASNAAFAGTTVIALLAAVYLLRTNPANAHWTQSYDPLGHWLLSTALAAAPVAVLLGLMALLRVKAHLAALAGLATALLVAVAAFHMPVRLALTAAASGACYGLFPICWIILPVIFLYQLTVLTGRFTSLQQSLTSITPDSRLQLLLIAFALGAFFEGASGFGTPVAVCGAILISLGFRPIHAAGLSLIANTAPVAFGSLGIPMIALHGVTGIDLLALTRMTALLLAPFCFMVPFWLIWTFAGFKAMREVWPAILVASATYTSAVLLMGVFVGPALVDIVAATSTIVVLIVFFCFWKPRRILNAMGEEITSQASTRAAQSPAQTFRAWMPWLVLSLVVFGWGIRQFSQWADARTTVKLPIAGLNNAVQRVPPVVVKPLIEPAVFNFNWLAATGTGSLAAALLAGLLMGLGPKTLARVFFQTVLNIRFTMATIAAMLALGYTSRYCGLDSTLGLAFARTGALYPFFGAFIGWLGTASTGSDTSSNVLFGSLQQTTARQLGISPVLMCAANSTAGIMGKMIAAPSIVVASTATGSYGQEGSILRYVFLHSLALATLVGLWVLILAYVHPFTALVVR